MKHRLLIACIGLFTAYILSSTPVMASALVSGASFSQIENGIEISLPTLPTDMIDNEDKDETQDSSDDRVNNNDADDPEEEDVEFDENDEKNCPDIELICGQKFDLIKEMDYDADDLSGSYFFSTDKNVCTVGRRNGKITARAAGFATVYLVDRDGICVDATSVLVEYYTTQKRHFLNVGDNIPAHSLIDVPNIAPDDIIVKGSAVNLIYDDKRVPILKMSKRGSAKVIYIFGKENHQKKITIKIKVN